MARLRVAAFVSGGPVALCALDALAGLHQIVVIVRAEPVRPPHRAWRGILARAARALGLRPDHDVAAWARGAGVPVIISRAGDEARTANRIHACAPDIGCIATYPKKIPETLLAASGRVCLNLHPSLLPRHRGANPLFWTYHAGDLQGGVTVHLATTQVDAGAILLRDRLPIARGESVVDVHRRGAELGGPLLARAVTLWSEGSHRPEEQDESAATRAPSPVPGRPYADLATWTSEHAWHFLAGLLARYREPLRDTTGSPVNYGRVAGFEARDAAHAPGSVVRDGAGWAVWTRDGVVHLSGASGAGR